MTDTTAAERAGGLRYCDYYGQMTYSDYLAFAASQTAHNVISERSK